MGIPERRSEQLVGTLITKPGQPVATISPIAADTRHGPKNLIIDFRKRFAKSLKPFTDEEIVERKEAARR